MNYQTIIVGAGPAGLQLGYFLQKGAIEYMILERAASAASFFQTYPHTGKLISINKPNTGRTDPEFNLRHDWNSLLEDGPIRFTEYTDDYYPDQKDLVEYMNDYATRNKLKIKYNTNVAKITKHKKLYVLHLDNGEMYTCTKLVMATGLSAPVIPPTTGNVVTPIKHYGEYEKDYFKKEDNLELYKNKSLLIVGNGNSAYELANLLTPYCSTIIIQGRKPKPWALSTHYTGDLRSTYLPFFDTFLLKSLNGLNNTPVTLKINQETAKSKYTLGYLCSNDCKVVHPYFRDSIEGFDAVIYCTGWRFDTSIFDFKVPLTSNYKYPLIDYTYENVSNDNLFFIGSLMHSHDYKESSGGFIHGFRYLIRYFYQIHYSALFDTHTFDDINTLVDHIIKRINTSSALYQMYGQMCDLISYDETMKKYTYMNDISILHPRKEGLYFILTLEYGKKPVIDLPKLGENRPFALERGKEAYSNLLHPILRVVNTEVIDEIHFEENILANFTDTLAYKDKFIRCFKAFSTA